MQDTTLWWGHIRRKTSLASIKTRECFVISSIFTVLSKINMNTASEEWSRAHWKQQGPVWRQTSKNIPNKSADAFRLTMPVFLVLSHNCCKIICRITPILVWQRKYAINFLRLSNKTSPIFDGGHKYRGKSNWCLLVPNIIRLARFRWGKDRVDRNTYLWRTRRWTT